MLDRQRPFAFAGIWNSSINEESGESENSFAIITTTANSLLAGMGYNRMPVILSNKSFNRWINPSTSLSEILSMLCAFPACKMNLYPISMRIAERSVNEKSLVSPMGASINDEPIGIQPVRSARRNKFSQNEKQTLGDRIIKSS